MCDHKRPTRQTFVITGCSQSELSRCQCPITITALELCQMLPVGEAGKEYMGSLHIIS